MQKNRVGENFGHVTPVILLQYIVDPGLSSILIVTPVRLIAAGRYVHLTSIWYRM